MFVNPWTYYIINDPDKIPDLTPHDDEEAAGCILGFFGFVISSIIYALLQYVIYTLLINDIMLYFLCILLNSIVVFPILTILLMKLSFRIAERITVKRNVKKDKFKTHNHDDRRKSKKI